MRSNLELQAVDASLAETFVSLTEKTEVTIDPNVFMGCINGLVPRDENDQRDIRAAKDHLMTHATDESTFTAIQLSGSNVNLSLVRNDLTIAFTGSVTNLFFSTN